MDALKEFFGQAPKIIAEAARSPLGVIVLVILALSLLGGLFFADAPVAVQVGIFVILVIFFGLLVFLQSPGAPIDSGAGDGNKPKVIAGGDVGDKFAGDKVEGGQTKFEGAVQSEIYSGIGGRNTLDVATTRVELRLEIPQEEFDETKQRLLQYALAGFLEISPSDVRIISIQNGSVKITIEIPTHCVEKLIDAIVSQDAELLKNLRSLVVSSIRQTPKSLPKQPTENQTFDAFISYSHLNREWVSNWLLPRLEGQGLSVCIDVRDFQIGMPSVVNMERAVGRSRHTLLVLTPDWIRSEWTNFEALMIQTKDPIGLRRRILPLMLEKCELPERIGIFTYADFTHPENREAELSRLVDQIQKVSEPIPQLEPYTIGQNYRQQPFPKPREDIVQGDIAGRDIIHGDRIAGNGIAGDKAERDIVLGDQYNFEKAVIASVEKSAGELVYSRHQLPKPSADFTGREEYLEQIKGALRRGGAAVTASLEGMGGIGKTATALVAANDLVAEGLFPDAQIFIDLQGFTPGSAPKTPVAAMTELLRPFVASDVALPENEETLAQLWRAATAGLDMLLFLDNGRDEAQLRPLLPRHNRCATIITSRNRLALDGLSAIDLGVMEEKEAVQLASTLANRRDAARLTDQQAEDLVELCGRLPMAIEIAANTLAIASGWETGKFLTSLSDISKTFDMLQRGERSLKASLGVSLDTLEMETRVRWQTLGVFERGFDAFVAGSLWKIEDPQPILAELEARSLVNFNKEANRHHLHDLLRALALEELSQDTERETEVYHRHAAFFLMALRVADEFFNRGHDAVARGLALLDRELANIRAGQRRSASRADESDEAAGLARDYPHFHCLRLRLLPDEYIGWLEAALAAALKLRDRKAEAIARGNLGISYSRKGDLDAAEEMYRKSLAIDEEMGHREGMANQFGNLGILYSTRGDLDAAEEMLGKGLAINEEFGDRRGMAIQYSGLGNLYSKRGNLDAAEEMHRKSFAIEEELGRREGMANDYGNLGILYVKRGDLDAAEEMLGKSLAINEELGDRKNMANDYANLGILYRARGDPDAAEEMYRKSLTLFRGLGAVDRTEYIEGLLRQLDDLRKQT